MRVEVNISNSTSHPNTQRRIGQVLWLGLACCLTAERGRSYPRVCLCAWSVRVWSLPSRVCVFVPRSRQTHTTMYIQENIIKILLEGSRHPLFLLRICVFLSPSRYLDDTQGGSITRWRNIFWRKVCKNWLSWYVPPSPHSYFIYIYYSSIIYYFFLV